MEAGAISPLSPPLCAAPGTARAPVPVPLPVPVRVPVPLPVPVPFPVRVPLPVPVPLPACADTPTGKQNLHPVLLAHVLIGTSPPKANSDLPVCTDSAVLKAGISNKSGSVKSIGKEQPSVADTEAF